MTRDVSIAPRNGRSADGSNSRTGGRSRVLNVQGSILKGIYRPLITLWYFVLPGQETFGSHLMFLLTDGKYLQHYTLSQDVQHYKNSQH